MTSNNKIAYALQLHDKKLLSCMHPLSIVSHQLFQFGGEKKKKNNIN